MKFGCESRGIILVNNTSSEQGKDATLNDVVVVLQNNQETLDQVLMWIKISGTNKVKALLNSVLDTPKKKIVYHLSDDRNSTEISVACGVSQSTISRYWNSWHKLGLMKTQKVQRGNRSIKNFDLEDFGIEVPKIVHKQSTKELSQVQSKGEVLNDQSK